MKVAFSTTDGIYANEHFGRSGLFAIYEVDENEYRFVEMRSFAVGTDLEIVRSRDTEEHESLVEKKIEKLSDCKIIYVTAVGGPSAARLIKKNIFPVKVKDDTRIVDELEKLKDSLKNKKIPWLQKNNL